MIWLVFFGLFVMASVTNSTSDILKQSDMTVVTGRQCERIWGRQRNHTYHICFNDDNSHFNDSSVCMVCSCCEGSRETSYTLGYKMEFSSTGEITRNPSLGDSGGPFVCANDGGHTLAGLTSWGSSVCHVTLPNVYTRISSFRDWIDSKIQN